MKKEPDCDAIRLRGSSQTSGDIAERVEVPAELSILPADFQLIALVHHDAFDFFSKIRMTEMVADACCDLLAQCTVADDQDVPAGVGDENPSRCTAVTFEVRVLKMVFVIHRRVAVDFGKHLPDLRMGIGVGVHIVSNPKQALVVTCADECKRDFGGSNRRRIAIRVEGIAVELVHDRSELPLAMIGEFTHGFFWMACRLRVAEEGDAKVGTRRGGTHGRGRLGVDAPTAESEGFRFV